VFAKSRHKGAVGALSHQALAVALTLIPAAIVFALVSFAMKGRGAIDALRLARGESATNLALVVINSVVLGSLVKFADTSIEAQLKLLPALAASWLRLPGPAVLLAALLILEFTVYWRHRAEHLPLLWPIHATHHSDEAVTWLTLLRKHPLSHVFSKLVDSIPLVVLGFPLWAVLAATLIQTFWGFFIHADLPWTLGPLGKVLISPAAHRLHHIDDEVLKDRNFGGVLSIYDRLFGTFDDASQHLRCKTGIDGGSRSLGGELARPIEALAKRGKRPAASPVA
jgi:sterol desaturase/sphingolipid hydroxylase (fatty acid hydroxylase superfamily)